eukprot:4809048-Amphidinium_carterae.1
MWLEDNEAECRQSKRLPAAVSTDDCSTAASNDEGSACDTPVVTSDDDDEVVMRATRSPSSHGNPCRPQWLQIFFCCRRRAPPSPVKCMQHTLTTAMPARHAQARCNSLKQRAGGLGKVLDETSRCGTPAVTKKVEAPAALKAAGRAGGRLSQSSPPSEPATIAHMLPELMPLRVVHPPPGLPPPSPANLLSMRGADPAVAGFDVARFRKRLVGIMRDLASSRNVAEAVRRVRAEAVPVERHAVEFADVVTRALEEFRGPVRRSYIAFAAGLAVASPSAFDRAQCM